MVLSELQIRSQVSLGMRETTLHAQVGIALRCNRDNVSLKVYQRATNDTYHNAPGREVVYRLGQRVLDADRPVVQGTGTRAEDRDRDDVDHKVTEEVQRVDRLLALVVLEDLQINWGSAGHRSGWNQAPLTCTTLTTESFTSGWNWVRCGRL